MSDMLHEKQWLQLRQAYERQRLGHAYIFSGDKHIGKREFAYRFIENIENNKACCHIILPEKDIITIDMIRALEGFVTQKIQGVRKWVIVEDAHQLNLAASHALLKTLEEPINTTFFLVTHQLFSLLPTIRSRCQIINFQGHVNVDDNMGRGQLLALSDGEIDALWLAEQWGKSIVEEQLYLIYDLMHDLLMTRFSIKSDRIINESEKAQLIKLSGTMQLSRVWKVYDAWRFIQAELKKGINLNQILMFESILIKWRQIWEG